ncbi:transposase [Sulfurimonas paralvinellae]|uniref:Transposase n=1 Tax=Sulfurimonas paralvinellae TaxID=317658 RepID=A0A7M1BAY4_9BACT|nr:transposase [Sulfurimonas paralvinellae]QOP46791.1 transposase [Sulfurimonas paralvinellae]
MQWLTECLFCGNYVYRLKDNRIKCSSCHKKISLQKLNKIIFLIEAFIENENALHIAKRMHMAYSSVHTYFEEFRLLCAKIAEEEYELYREKNCEYEEYFYLEKSKKNNPKAIFDAHNFLTFDYDGHIYTLLMPSLQPYKQQFLQDNLQNPYLAEFNKFKRISRIAKVSKRYNQIVKFWEYFEQEILKYKGVKSEVFIYFLKEFEFKFNHENSEAIKILMEKYVKEKL